MDRNHMFSPAFGASFRRSPQQSRRESSNNNNNRAMNPLPAGAPPSYTPSRSLSAISLSDAAIDTELPPILPRTAHNSDASNNTLPSISSVTRTSHSLSQGSFTPPMSTVATSPPDSGSAHWPSLNPLTAYYTPSHAQSEEPPLRLGSDGSGRLSNEMPSPAVRPEDRANSVNLDDPDVRLAAQALGDLRADFLSSPDKSRTPLPPGSPALGGQQPEPLFYLLTTSHPLLAKTIEGTTSAYNTSKNFSPRFKSSAEYMEGYLTPLGNTLGSVGRATGVEGGVRWFLGAGRRNRSSEADGSNGSSKRRKMDTSNGSVTLVSDRAPVLPEIPPLDPFAFTNERRPSLSTIDTLPAYDDARSPAYSECVDAHLEPSHGAKRSSGPAQWQSRLMMSTSGLSVAMSEESLRRLKYCLRWLRWANEHIAKIIDSLKATLEQFDKRREAAKRGTSSSPGPGRLLTWAQEGQDLAAHMNALRGDILKTLRDVITTVSKYAGGSLPENASILVRRHLTSLPQRFRVATQTEASKDSNDPAARDEATRENAQKVLVLAKEGLEMMSQVSGVLDGTIVSAEEWCSKLGKRKESTAAGEPTAELKASDTKVLSPVERERERGTDVVMA